MKTLRIRWTLAGVLLLAAAVVACGGEDDGGKGGGADSTSGADTAGSTSGTGGELTLANCTTSISDDAPAFYKTYFRCVTITMDGGDVVIESKGLAPHKSFYYGEGHANFAEFDYSRGSEYRPNPNKIVEQGYKIQIPSQPTAKGLTIDAALVDKTVGTSDDEFPMGVAGISLDSVPLFNPLAAPGDDIEDEKYTFDSYEAHPQQQGQYHYHSATPGPLEVLVAAGIATASTPGAAEVELYGIMCDGTLVLGCTELDGSALNAAALDGQNGHSHDITDGTTTHFTGRYHTHICEGTGTHKFTPEIQFYNACEILAGGMTGGPPPRP